MTHRVLGAIQKRSDLNVRETQTPRRVRCLGTLLVLVFALGTPMASSQEFVDDRFRQLEEILPTPSDVRTASGAPGSRYWQQRADYVIDVTLDDENQRIIGRERLPVVLPSGDRLFPVLDGHGAPAMARSPSL